MNKPILQVGTQYGFEFQGKQNDLALFAVLGNAVAVIQSFETSIMSYLGLLSDKEKGESEIERFYTFTLGQLIREFKKHLPDSGIAELLDTVRKKRNFLIHNILKDYQWPMMNDEDYAKAIFEIDEIRFFIENANVEVSEYLKDNKLLNLIVLSIKNDTGKITKIV